MQHTGVWVRDAKRIYFKLSPGERDTHTHIHIHTWVLDAKRIYIKL